MKGPRPAESNLVAAFAARVARFGAREALRVRRDGAWRPVSWEEVRLAWEETAAGLLSLGISPGDRVAILSENRPEWVFADLGSLAAGGVVVPLYWTSPPPQVAYILRDSGCRVAFVSNGAHLEKILAVRGALPRLETVVVFDPPAGKDLPSGVVTMAELRRRGREQLPGRRHDLERVRETAGESALATLVYTSGTTGDPKGVMLTHGNIIANVRAALSVFDIRDTDVVLSFLPLCHVLERTCGYYAMLLAGATVVYAESVEKVAANLGEVRPTILISVPRIYEKIHDRFTDAVRKMPLLRRMVVAAAFAVGHRVSRGVQVGWSTPFYLRLANRVADRLVLRKVRDIFGGRGRILVSGGAALNPRLARFFHSAGVHILEGYGLTETAPIIAVNLPERFRFGSVGPVLPNLELRIAADGEISVRGPSVMKGYWGKEAETAEVLSPDGWLATGDIGKLDPRGFLWITDRKKDIIVTAGGKNVAPQALEGALTADAFISQAVVFGDGRKYLSALIVPDWERVRAWMAVKGQEAGATEELCGDLQVRDFIRRRIAHRLRRFSHAEQVRAFALLPREFTQEGGEVTPTLKLRRKEIAAHHARELEALY